MTDQMVELEANPGTVADLCPFFSRGTKKRRVRIEDRGEECDWTYDTSHVDIWAQEDETRSQIQEDSWVSSVHVATHGAVQHVFPSVQMLAILRGGPAVFPISRTFSVTRGYSLPWNLLSLKRPTPINTLPVLFCSASHTNCACAGKLRRSSEFDNFWAPGVVCANPPNTQSTLFLDPLFGDWIITKIPGICSLLYSIWLRDFHLDHGHLECLVTYAQLQTSNSTFDPFVIPDTLRISKQEHERLVNSDQSKDPVYVGQAASAKFTSTGAVGMRRRAEQHWQGIKKVQTSDENHVPKLSAHARFAQMNIEGVEIAVLSMFPFPVAEQIFSTWQRLSNNPSRKWWRGSQASTTFTFHWLRQNEKTAGNPVLFQLSADKSAVRYFSSATSSIQRHRVSLTHLEIFTSDRCKLNQAGGDFQLPSFHPTYDNIYQIFPQLHTFALTDMNTWEIEN
ncbi:hypothetical protein NQ176_g6279 [Zarea fungicola]|uniref:Uncharacterized protein n=1 Tax=Zarea fungicola TaxID=93591 RepID=A0ACC1N441_9HYPO|nr:hypothetical protein NQ176_g6279 [Lecanicillium fungicola]